MTLQGRSPSDIADELGYASGVEVSRAIKERMKSEATRLSAYDRESLLQMEIDRLNMLRSVHWEPAMLGDLKSGEMILKIADRLIKVTGLDALDTATHQATVLVIGGQEQDYVNKLKELTE